MKEQIENGTWCKSSERVTENISAVANGSQNNDKGSQVNDKVANSENSQETKFSEGDNEKMKELGNEMNVQDGIRVASKCPFAAKRLANADKDETVKEDIGNEDKSLSNGCVQEVNDKDISELDDEGAQVKDVSENKNGEEARKDASEIDKAKVGEEIPYSRQPVVLPGGIVMPPPRVETVSTSWKTQPLTHDQVNDYCKRLFKFKTVNIMHFK